MTAHCMEIVVSGRVQGVSFRASTAHKAEQLGLDGNVRNLHDGRVRILAQGDPRALEALLGWAKQGPAAARVDRVEKRSVAQDAGLSGFRIVD